MRKVTVNTQEEMGQFTTLLEQTFQGMRVVKSYCMEEYERTRIRIIAERIFTLVFKASRVRALSSPIMESLGGVAITMVIAYGGHQVIHDNMDPGSFFSFITALLLAYEPMKRLANLNASLQEGLASAERLFQLMDRQPTIVDEPNSQLLNISGGRIRFENICFSYVTTKATLSGINFDVPAGKTVALVGPSGAGKSTILNLIPRFYDVDKGVITIDGTDIRDTTLKSLRRSMALVSQEITLFDEIIQAAKNAAAHDFVVNMPEGYDTYVGESGTKISGGQRQRIAIARAMLKNAPILLLDEATSALDTESERSVQVALRRLMQGRTTLVIAHRLSTVIDADLIHVIDNGTVAESGSHKELIDKDGIYARLYHMQFDENHIRGKAASAQ
jgi:subfamily B ATP-binding cassette protein MsbA